MSVTRRGWTPPAVISRNVLLSEELAPTARLLYAVALATADDEQIRPALLGFETQEQAEPFYGQLEDAGLIERIQHHGEDTETLTVHHHPVPPEERGCHPCTDCHRCACRNGQSMNRPDLCRNCAVARERRRLAEIEIEQWRKRRAEGADYARGKRSALLHRWDCPSLATPEKLLLALDDPDLWGPPSLPRLYTAEELRPQRRRRGCQMCKPDPV